MMAIGTDIAEILSERIIHHEDRLVHFVIYVTKYKIESRTCKVIYTKQNCLITLEHID